ncbi:hypothetical protein GN956_G18727 [Arapaima gigas]
MMPLQHNVNRNRREKQEARESDSVQWMFSLGHDFKCTRENGMRFSWTTGHSTLNRQQDDTEQQRENETQEDW